MKKFISIVMVLVLGLVCSQIACFAKEVDIGYDTSVDEAIYNDPVFRQKLEKSRGIIADIDRLNPPTDPLKISCRAGQMLMTPSGFSYSGTGDPAVNSFTGHAGIVARNARTAVEAGRDPATGVWCVHFRETAYDWTSRYKKCYGLGCRVTSDAQDHEAGFFAEKQNRKPYWLDLIHPYRTDQYFCSSLVLCCYYYAAGVDLKDSYMGSFIPDDVLQSSKTFVEWRQG